MTASLGPMDDAGVVDLLQAAGHGGGDATHADVTRAITAGRKIRRRRQAMQVVGSGLGVTVVLAGGFTAVSALGGGEDRTTVTAAGDPSTAPKPDGRGAPRVPVSTNDQRIANLQLLADKLGPDFRVNLHGRLAGDLTTDPKVPTYPVVEAVPGSPTAERIPAGYRMTASDGAPVIGKSLESTCKQAVEKATHTSACAPVTTTDGQTVQVQEFRVEFGKFVDSTGKRLDAAGTSAYFPRADGSFVQADLSIVAQLDTAVTAATHDRAESLVADFRDALVAYAADPQVGPAPGPANGQPVPQNPGRPTTHERNQAYLQEALGSPTFGLYDREVMLEPNKGAYKDLPSPYFSGTASVVPLTQAQFDAACGEKPGFAGCTAKTLPGGIKVYTNRWADRDAATDELRGESSAYHIRPDGNIVVATISLQSSDVTKANRDEQVNGTLAWLDSFQDELIAAAIDPRMKFDN